MTFGPLGAGAFLYHDSGEQSCCQQGSDEAAGVLAPDPCFFTGGVQVLWLMLHKSSLS
jgi:hypothetical protein